MKYHEEYVFLDNSSSDCVNVSGRHECLADERDAVQIRRYCECN